ncbi:hypothetical protein LJR220_003399 [Bradyrhizobium sp. LjRoot220]|uniref:hypothetical protein n=1 Tax=Bradyrhizobium sp. LjRoot220 TaxID=3342284 RepID=UPI003ECD28D8
MSMSWDSMIAGDDAEVSAEIAADASAYAQLCEIDDSRGCLTIEEKYGLAGLPPQQVTEILAEMAKPDEGGAA